MGFDLLKHTLTTDPCGCAWTSTLLLFKRFFLYEVFSFHWLQSPVPSFHLFKHRIRGFAHLDNYWIAIGDDSIKRCCWKHTKNKLVPSSYITFKSSTTPITERIRKFGHKSSPPKPAPSTSLDPEKAKQNLPSRKPKYPPNRKKMWTLGQIFPPLKHPLQKNEPPKK